MEAALNMFSVRKVKLHGMQSAKWTTKDKISQYRGLISLYTRDRKIIEVDTNVNRKRLQKELNALRNTVDSDRLLLDNAIRGDKQHLRNTLGDHRELKLAYQNSQPYKIIDCLDQHNFTQRKALDNLVYHNNLKSKHLIDLKQEQALLQDRLKYAFLGQIQQEKDAQIITGKVQDAILKREAAMAIKHIYMEIVHIMKKDTLYYDAILNTIENDGFNQSRCFLGATTLGQLATEYLDDRKQEYYVLERMIVQDMTTRKKDIKQLKDSLQKASAGVKDLLRKDSDINTCSTKLPDTPSMERLRVDVAEIESTLQFLKNTTAVYSYEAIYPCLNQQVEQEKRLKTMKKKCERHMDILLNKLNHAELMTGVLENTMVDTTSDYTKRKKQCIREMEKLNRKKNINNAKVQHKNDVFANIAIALRQLLQLSKYVKTEEELKQLPPPQSTVIDPLNVKAVEPEKDIYEALKILPIITTKFTYLMTNHAGKEEEGTTDEIYRMFENMVHASTLEMAEADKKIMQTSLLEGIFQETSTQLTREDIKKQSDEIVAANSKNEDLVPLFVAPRKSKFLKKKK